MTEDMRRRAIETAAHVESEDMEHSGRLAERLSRLSDNHLLMADGVRHWRLEGIQPEAQPSDKEAPPEQRAITLIRFDRQPDGSMISHRVPLTRGEEVGEGLE